MTLLEEAQADVIEEVGSILNLKHVPQTSQTSQTSKMPTEANTYKYDLETPIDGSMQREPIEYSHVQQDRTTPIWMDDDIMNTVNQLIYSQSGLDETAIREFLTNPKHASINGGLEQLKRCMLVIAHNRDCVECKSDVCVGTIVQQLQTIFKTVPNIPNIPNIPNSPNIKLDGNALNAKAYMPGKDVLDIFSIPNPPFGVSAAATAAGGATRPSTPYHRRR